MTLFATFSASGVLHELLKRHSGFLVFGLCRKGRFLVRSFLSRMLSFLDEFRCFLDLLATSQGFVV